MTSLGRCVGLAVVLLLQICAPAGAHEDAAALPVARPATIQVDALLEPVLAAMLEKSPTFRRQCGDIARAQIVVAVHLVAAPKDSGTHAMSTLRRYSSGLMVAQVEVPVGSALTQLIAHEFEHIAEFIEGVDLEALADEGTRRASRRRDGAFETARAIVAGRTVHAELSAR